MGTLQRSAATRAAWPCALGALGGVALAGLTAAPVQAYQLGGLIKGAAGAVSSRLPGQKDKPPASPAAPGTPAAPGAPANPGAMGLQAQTGAAPLHKLGTDAVAVVETATGTTAVRPMDYVFAKQTLSLGPKGAVTLSYLSGCLTEQIQGGVVTVAAAGSKVAGGKLAARPTPGCRTATPVILASASEAGATVNRITPFTGLNWDERILKGGPPTFKWDKALGAVTLRVKDMDQPGEPVIWTVSAAAGQDWAAYPAKAQRLAPGMPFKAEALAGDKVVASALFSIDPALDAADSLANRLVPLSAP